MMIRGVKKGSWIAALVAAMTLVAVPASASNTRPAVVKSGGVMRGFSGFTPAAADPRLAAAFSRSTTLTSGFRFTSTSAAKGNRKVTVAVRSRTTSAGSASDRGNGLAGLGMAPVAYNLGISVGWRRFAISGDIGEADLGPVEGRRRATDVGLSYTVKRWTTRVQLAAERPVGTAPRLADSRESVALDFGGSYSLSRNFAVTAGVRYKSEREKFESRMDTRRDSQAVYLGTAFRF
jgi:hypothetical protein